MYCSTISGESDLTNNNPLTTYNTATTTPNNIFEKSSLPSSSAVMAAANSYTTIMRQYPQSTNNQLYVYSSPDYSQVMTPHTTLPLSQPFQPMPLLTSSDLSVSHASPSVLPSPAPSSSSLTPPIQSFELQDVLQQFSTQPEILRLILISKVEEDKRRTAEAMLRTREIERMQSQERERNNFGNFNSGNNNDCNNDDNNNDDNDDCGDNDDNDDTFSRLRMGNSDQSDEMLVDSRLRSRVPVSRSSGQSRVPMDSDGSYDQEDFSAFHPPPGAISLHLPYSFDIPTQPHGQPPPIADHRRDSALGSFSSSNISIDDINDKSDSAVSQCAKPFPAIQSLYTSIASRFPNSRSSSDHLSPQGQENDKRKRKRREMQAVSLIIETKDNPYIDNFQWKNNGNTTQKKTGNKSVYYKCSNSGKGCPVNKTVTFQDDGTFLIKYRGEHLKECGKVKRIVNT